LASGATSGRIPYSPYPLHTPWKFEMTDWGPKRTQLLDRSRGHRQSGDLDDSFASLDEPLVGE
jgi:hypothetical protein